MVDTGKAGAATGAGMDVFTFGDDFDQVWGCLRYVLRPTVEDV